MKKCFCMLFSCIVFLLSLCACNDSTEEPIKPTNPISGIYINNDDTTLLIGESFTLDYTIYPADTNEEHIVESSDPSVADIINGKVVAKSEGTTYIKVRASYDTGHGYAPGRGEEIRVNVISSCSSTKFDSKYKETLRIATVDVYCKRYNTNWIGTKTDVYTISGKGTIIKSNSYGHYFLTDKTIFDKISKEYEYEEWYVIDYYGNKYAIKDFKYHTIALIGIGMFIKEGTYPIAKIYESVPLKGEYAVSISGSTSISRIMKTDYYSFTGSTTFSNSAHVIYHNLSQSQGKRGEAIYNSNGEIIGVNMMFLSDKTIAVSAIEIRELYNRMF